MSLEPATAPHTKQKLTVIALATSVGVLLLHGMTGWALINMPSPSLKPIEQRKETPIELMLVDLQEAPTPPKEITLSKPETKPNPKPKPESNHETQKKSETKPQPKQQQSSIQKKPITEPITKPKIDTTTVKKTIQPTDQPTIAKPKLASQSKSEPVQQPAKPAQQKPAQQKPTQQKPTKQAVASEPSTPKPQQTVLATNNSDTEAKRLADIEVKRRADAEAKRLTDLEAKRKADAEANKTHNFTISQARWKRKPKPKLPRSAKRTIKKGQQLTVRLQLVVDKQGKITSATVISSSGIQNIDSAAVTEAERSKLYPFIKNNVPVKGKINIPFHFMNN